MNVIKKADYKLPVYSWCPNIEENAQLQIDNMAKLPFTVHHISIMSDCHSGYGVPIGSVMACDSVVVPNSIGLDIGCSVGAIKTNLHIDELSTDEIKAIMGEIRQLIPVGFNWNKEPVAELKYSEDLLITRRELEKAKLQLGTLGGGNHFIEIQKDEDKYVWFMVHSGSRNVGKQIAQYYNKVAKDMNAIWYSSVPKEWDLAFIPRESPHFSAYLKEMKWAVEFAQQNINVMLEQIKKAFLKIINPVTFEYPVTITHNYAKWENINGKNLLIHRKGATSARNGEIGIIPGSQGSASYIVEGLGNVKSFYSCSHGAGRVMGRNDAKRSLNLEEEKAKLDKLGVIHAIRNQDDLEEATSAYKDIDEVMSSQEDLVKIIVKLTPVGVIKG